MGDKDLRLACYDAAGARLGAAEARGDLLVMDREQAAAVGKEAFGLALPSLGLISRALKTENVEQITSSIKALRADALGHWTFVLEDGAVWRQISGELTLPPRAGASVRIRKGAVGSYLMNIDRQTAIKVHRDR